MRRYLGRAIAPGAGGAPGVRVAMHGRIKLGPWVPFTATLETDGSRLRWRAELGPGRSPCSPSPTAMPAATARSASIWLAGSP